MNRADVVRQLLLWETVARRATARAGQLRDMLAAEARADLESQGMAPTWRLPEIATVSLPVSRERVTVVDPAALAGWVKTRHPGEVTTVVRPAFLRELTGRLAHDGETVTVPDTGEVVPGLTVTAGGAPQALRVLPHKDAVEVADAAAERLLSGLVEGLGL